VLRGFACLVFLGLFLGLASAPKLAASELPIVWTAPADCPDRADMLSRVEASMGDDGVPAGLRVTADVSRAADLFRARVSIRSDNGTGQRVLENRDCDLLADSVALVIALSASDSSRDHRDGGDEGLTLALSAHATAASGPLPALALGVGGALAIEGLSALRLELSGSYYASQTSTYDQMNVGAGFRLLRFGARGCRLWTVGLFELAPCLGVQVYRIEGKGFGGMRGTDGHAYLWGPALGVFGRLRVSRGFALAIAADAMLPVSRQRFVYTDVGPLHRPDVFAFQLFISPEVRF
jgi:hypothetical protein